MLYLILFSVLEEVLAFRLIEIVEAKHRLAVKAGTLHHATPLEFVGRDDDSTGRTGVGDNTHG